MSDDENRKRVHQQDELDMAISSKRAALSASENVPTHPETYGNNYNSMNNTSMYGNQFSNNNNMFVDNNSELMFKILCPQTITGLIIGRAGSIINQLNATTGAKIKLSQNTEHFPGTNDRILIITGPREGITNAVKELVTRIVEAPEKKPHTNSPQMLDMYGNPIAPANRGPQGSFLIRVLIPKIASAAIIGKGGSVIKHMAELSGCKFQLGDESDPFNTKERIVTITGPTVPSIVTGSQTIMAQLIQDVRIRNYPNTTTNYGVASNMVMQAGMTAPPPGVQAGFKGGMVPGPMGMPGAPFPGAAMNAPYNVAAVGPYMMPPYGMHPGMLPHPQAYSAGVIPPQHQQYYATMAGQTFSGANAQGSSAPQTTPANVPNPGNPAQAPSGQQHPSLMQPPYFPGAMPGYDQNQQQQPHAFTGNAGQHHIHQQPGSYPQPSYGVKK